MKKQQFNVLMIILASLLVVYFVLKDDFADIVNSISNINIYWFIFSIALVLLYWVFQTICLATVANAAEEKVSFKTLFQSTIICNFFSAITPSATGGQPLQIFYLRQRGLKLGTATNLVVEQSTLYQIALVLMGLVAIILNYFFDFFPSDKILKNLVLIGFALNTAVIIMLAYITFGKKSNKFLILKFVKFLHRIKIIRNEEKALNKAEQIIDHFYISAKTLNSNKEALIKGVIYNFIALSLLYIIPLTVAYALGDYVSLNMLTTLVASAYVMLIGAFVPIPGGSGGIEFAFASFFGYYITGSTLMAMLLIWRFVTYYLSILIGGLVFIVDRDGGK